MTKVLRVLLLFIITSSQGQTVLLDVPYVTQASQSQTMDVYIPSSKKFPTILFVHGGSLTSGDKRDEPLEKIAKKFQADGIAFVLMNYRLGPSNVWPAQPDDVAAAFSWIKKTINQYQGDSSNVFIAGHSSGAMLTSLVSSDKKYLINYKHSIKDISGFILIGTQLKSTLPAVSPENLSALFKKNDYLKIFGDTTTFNDASVMRHITCDIPPGLIIIAEKEQFSPPILEQTKEFIDKSRKCKSEIKYEVIAERTHMSNLTKMIESNDPVYNLIKDFVDAH